MYTLQPKSTEPSKSEIEGATDITNAEGATDVTNAEGAADLNKLDITQHLCGGASVYAFAGGYSNIGKVH